MEKNDKKGMTWSELLAIISNPEFQRINKDKEIHTWVEDDEVAKGGLGVWVLNEDYVNPSGECIEPISNYNQDNIESEDLLTKDDLIVMACKGYAFLTINWQTKE
ncbi:hypothetical protein SAMN04515674_104259 [Pseudarcicella hirudinis]|uniref:Uncharacterized protein n=1 Tax=Pseudarcicella hirudinis TaxID=1079859 RepID=A0A1I5RV69_9BACT|nr:hypothetical protein [Pseudarcicella hirudinis]SFP62317.1 hypothetical protein SAMN04515674_104259 [Pseudarcicella hirudinis]